MFDCSIALLNRKIVLGAFSSISVSLCHLCFKVIVHHRNLLCEDSPRSLTFQFHSRCKDVFRCELFVSEPNLFGNFKTGQLVCPSYLGNIIFDKIDEYLQLYDVFVLLCLVVLLGPLFSFNLTCNDNRHATVLF